MDVFATLQVGKVVLHSKVHKGGNDHPEWMQVFHIPFDLDLERPARDDGDILVVSLFAKTTLASSVIGRFAVQLKDLTEVYTDSRSIGGQPSHADQRKDRGEDSDLAPEPVLPTDRSSGAWFMLTRDKQKVAGHILLSFSILAGKTTDQEETDWQNDGEVEVCPLCEVEFSLMQRRHHCRKCGMVMCNTCSSGRMALEEGGTVVRVCDACDPNAASVQHPAQQRAVRRSKNIQRRSLRPSRATKLKPKTRPKAKAKTTNVTKHVRKRRVSTSMHSDTLFTDFVLEFDGDVHDLSDQFSLLAKVNTPTVPVRAPARNKQQNSDVTGQSVVRGGPSPSILAPRPPPRPG